MNSVIPIRDANRSLTTPHVTRILIIVNVLVFFFNWILGSLDSAIMEYGMIPNLIIQDPFPRLGTFFTSMFFHADLFHLGFNMLYLYIFGDNVEDRMGTMRYVVFYLLAGSIAAITHIILSPELNVPTVGASGAVAGVLGAYFLLFPSARVTTFIPVFFLPWFVDIPAFFYLGIWFFSQVVNGLMVGDAVMNSIAWWAHIGGFIAGLLLVRIFAPRLRTVEVAYHQGQKWPQKGDSIW